MTIVGQNVTGSWEPTEGWDMTKDENAPYIWTYIFNGFYANAETYEYKAVANKAWGIYELPASGNQTFTFGTEVFPVGNYDLTFTVNTLEHTLTLVPTPVTYTVTFVNGDSWENVYAYTWTEGEADQNAAWPGVKIEPVDGVYTYSVKYVAPQHIIFNNGGDIKTDNLDFVNGETYTYKDGNVSTGIESINTAKAATAIFNMAGQRVVKAQKGLYIVNGKKVLVK